MSGYEDEQGYANYGYDDGEPDYADAYQAAVAQPRRNSPGWSRRRCSAQQQQINQLSGFAHVAGAKAERDLQRQDLEVAQRARDLAAKNVGPWFDEHQEQIGDYLSRRPGLLQDQNMGDAEAAANDLITAAHAYRLEHRAGPTAGPRCSSPAGDRRDQRHAPNQQMVSPRLGLPRIVNADDRRRTEVECANPQRRLTTNQPQRRRRRRPADRRDQPDPPLELDEPRPMTHDAGTAGTEPEPSSPNPEAGSVQEWGRQLQHREGPSGTPTERPEPATRPHCKGQTKAGQPCQSTVVGSDGFCVGHSEERRDTLKEEGRRGGKTSGERRWCQRWGSLRPSV